MLEVVTSLAVSADDTKLAVYGSKFDTNKYSNYGYIWIVRVEDGHYYAGLREIIHGDNDKANIYVAAHGMYFDSYGIIYMAFGSEKHDKGMSDGSISDYAPKVAVGAYDGTTLSKIYYRHMSVLFGEGLAIAYADYGSSGSNVFIGGTVDPCYYSGNNVDPCFKLSID